MSHWDVGTTAGSLPPSVPTEFDTQSGNAVPDSNILIIDAFDTTEDNVNGIETKGGVAAGNPPGTGSTNEVSIYLTNRFHGSGITNSAVTTTIATLALGATPGNYSIEVYASGFEPSGPLGTSYNIVSCVRTTGLAATLVGISEETFVEDAGLNASDLQVTVSGNNVIVQAIGILGLTINWKVVANYVFTG